MFLKAKVKYIKSTGEHRLYYRLCESYRYEDTVRHHTIVVMGTLEQLPETSERNRIASLVKQNRTGQCDIFEPANATIEALAQKYFCRDTAQVKA
jgi:hypothetical protein